MAERTNNPGLTVSQPRSITEGLRSSSNIEDRRDDRNYDLRDISASRYELEDRQLAAEPPRKPWKKNDAKPDPTETASLDMRERYVGGRPRKFAIDADDPSDGPEDD